jgi:hypothetical protein
MCRREGLVRGFLKPQESCTGGLHYRGARSTLSLASCTPIYGLPIPTTSGGLPIPTSSRHEENSTTRPVCGTLCIHLGCTRPGRPSELAAAACVFRYKSYSALFLLMHVLATGLSSIPSLSLASWPLCRQPWRFVRRSPYTPGRCSLARSSTSCSFGVRLLGSFCSSLSFALLASCLGFGLPGKTELQGFQSSYYSNPSVFCRPRRDGREAVYEHFDAEKTIKQQWRVYDQSGRNADVEPRAIRCTFELAPMVADMTDSYGYGSLAPRMQK